MNYNLFLAINGLAGKSHILDVLGIFFADKFLYLFLLFVLALWFDKKVRYHVYLAIGSAAVSRLVIVEAMKRIFDHPRPYEVLSSIHQLLADNERGVSFPSGHATIYFALAFAFWDTKYFWPFFVLAVLGSVARVFVGVHYPSDVFVGAVIGLATALAFRHLFKKRFLS